MLARRVDMCRPHLLLLAFSVLVVGLLISWPEEPPRRAALATLAAVSALFSLAHSGAWIALFYAAIWALAGWHSAKGAHASPPRRLWLPLAATAAGWLLGQLV